MTNTYTKRDMYRDFMNAIEANDFTAIAEHADEIKEKLVKELDAIDAKNDKARERNAKKKAGEAVIYEQIMMELRAEPQTADQINESVVAAGYDMETVAKTRYKLGQLVKEGKAVKSDIKDGKRTIKGYALAD